MHLPLLVSATESYDAAHRETAKTGQPLVVMVGADWCPACQQMEKTVIPQVRERGLLRRVAFALVNLDRERDLAQNLIEGGPIPQLIVFRRSPDGWHRRRLIGGQSVETVEQVITEEVAENEAAANASKIVDKKPQSKPDAAAAKPVSRDPSLQASAKATIRPISSP
jgi:thioredoxin-like negative regulator of GroEL